MKKLVDGVLVDLTDQESTDRSEPMSRDDVEMLVRSDRDKRLRLSDLHALADRVTADWATYRQALRDITGQAGFPYAVTWPQEPSA